MNNLLDHAVERHFDTLVLPRSMVGRTIKGMTNLIVDKAPACGAGPDEWRAELERHFPTLLNKACAKIRARIVPFEHVHIDAPPPPPPEPSHNHKGADVAERASREALMTYVDALIDSPGPKRLRASKDAEGVGHGLEHEVNRAMADLRPLVWALKQAQHRARVRREREAREAAASSSGEVHQLV
jgi:hypothetical protein